MSRQQRRSPSLKAFFLSALDDLDFETRQDFGERIGENRPLINAVDEQFFEKGKAAEQRRKQQNAAVAILNVLMRWCHRLARSEGTKSFAFLIGAALSAGEFGFRFPKGYIYAALAFSGAVEGLEMLARRTRKQPPE